SLGVPGNVEWAETLSTTTTGPGTLGAWATGITQPPVWGPIPSGRLQLEVDSAEVAGVPEPSGLALLGLGGAGLLGWRVRRGRAGERFSSRAGPPPPGGRGPAARGCAPGTPTEKGGGHEHEGEAGGGRGGGGAAGGRGRGAGRGGAHRLQPQPDTEFRGVTN